MGENFKKVCGEIVKINNIKLEKFEKWHTYVKKGTDTGHLIKYVDEYDDDFILSQYEHWDKCFMCSLKKSKLWFVLIEELNSKNGQL